jgi:Zn-dependent metalloprotease
MKTLFYILIALFLGFSTVAQQKQSLEIKEFDNREAKISFPQLKNNQSKSNLEFCKEFISKQFPNLLYGDFRLKYAKNSLAAQHFLFEQYYENTPIYNGSIKISITNAGKISSVIDNSFKLAATIISTVKNPNTSAYVSQTFPTKSKLDTVYFAIDNQLVKGTILHYSSPNTLVGDKDILFDNLGNKLLIIDKLVYHSDSTIKTKIFRPDPLCSANVNYGGAYTDSNDSDVAVLNAQLKDAMLKTRFQNDTFYLQSDYCNLGEFDLPVKALCNTTVDSMIYTRANDCFEQVNIFYYINFFQEHIQNLGFNALGNHPIKVDAHGWNGQDNSSFSPSEDLLSFGEGGVDDGEDLDVILHEYQHAIASYAAPNTNSGSERRCLDEANGDYFAASYSRLVEPFNWDKVFSWDGHNQFWNGRNATSTKTYSTSMNFSNIYTHTDLWSSTLMEIWEDLGRDTTDQLLLESLHSYAANLKMNQAAKLFLLADSNLYGGQHAQQIISRFCARNLLTTDCNAITGIQNDIEISPNYYFWQ